MQLKAIQMKDALRLLEDGGPHTIRVWKLSTGDILTYTGARCVGHFRRQGIHRIKLTQSSLIRAMRDIALIEIDNLKIYL